MLEKLHTWMSSNRDKYIYILTDGDDQYDEIHFTNRFNQIDDRNHQVTVFDICKTNMDPLKRIFAKFGVQIVTEYHQMTPLLTEMQEVMKRDKIVIDKLAQVSSSVNGLTVAHNKLMNDLNALKIENDNLNSKSKDLRAAAEKALQNRLQSILTQSDVNLKNHMKELAEHVRKVKNNSIKIQMQELHIQENKIEIDELKTDIQSERQSGCPNQGKIDGYNMKVTQLETKLSGMNSDLEKMKKELKDTETEFEKLKQQTSQLQQSVTKALQTNWIKSSYDTSVLIFNSELQSRKYFK